MEPPLLPSCLKSKAWSLFISHLPVGMEPNTAHSSPVHVLLSFQISLDSRPTQGKLDIIQQCLVGGISASQICHMKVWSVCQALTLVSALLTTALAELNYQSQDDYGSNIL